MQFGVLAIAIAVEYKKRIYRIIHMRYPKETASSK
jgi:hypothetical protein